MKVEVDRRSCRVDAAPEAEKLLALESRHYIRLEVRVAKAMANVERNRAYLRRGHKSIESWAAEYGYGPRQVRHLLEIGRALLGTPALEEKVHAGAVTTEGAAQVGRVVRAGGDPAEWLAKAESMPPWQLAQAATRAIEEARQDETTFPLRFQVTRTAYEGFFRARLLMSRGKRAALTDGQTFARLVDDYLERHDPRRKPLPKRKAGAAFGRYISARVVAEVERRSGGNCEICGERRAIEKMHLAVPHALGGGREAENIGDGCHFCHTMLDAGIIEFAGFDETGKPEFVVHADRLVRERAPPYLVA
ncbi:MAG: hypothetical protein ACYTHK_18075 [Planctomycetota bacterium]